MSLASIPFFVFFALSLLCYYLTPKRQRWICLLCFSAVFFLLSSGPLSGIWLVLCIIATHFCSLGILCCLQPEPAKAKKYLILGISTDLVILAVLKYLPFPGKGQPGISSILILLGISFYTLQAISLLADTWRGVAVPEKNLFKTALFIAYYPQLTSGPIARYEDMKDTLFCGADFSCKNLLHGLRRMLWGLFKKLVLSARLGIMADAIYADTQTRSGFYVWAAAAFFMLQLYCDFSGCMDIIIGASESYGIRLPENFRTPFFSRSVQEYWQRWHITLGSFMRDYVYYPIQRSDRWKRMEKALEGRFGKKAGRQFSSLLGLLCVWLLIGLWHGGSARFLVGQGLWFWACMAAGKAGEPLWRKLRRLLRVRETAFSWHLFQSLRTFVLAAFGNIFFRASSLEEAFRWISDGIMFPMNPWIFTDGSFYRLGISQKEVSLTAVGLLVLLLVSVLQQNGSVREKIDRQDGLFRWALYFLLLFSVIIFGKYGPGWSTAEFIYRGF